MVEKDSSQSTCFEILALDQKIVGYLGKTCIH